MHTNCYNIIIIGSGMAGLYAAYQIKKKEHMKAWREKPDVIKKIKEYSKLY